MTRNLPLLPRIPRPRTADFAVVTDDRAARGQVIQQRRQAHQIRSVSMFAEATGKSRATITKAEAGIASPETIGQLERFLDRLDHERAMDTKPVAPAALTDLAAELGDIIEIEVTGPSTRQDWHITFRARPEHVDLITEQAAKLLREVESDD